MRTVALAGALALIAAPAPAQPAPAVCPVSAEHLVTNDRMGRSRDAVADGRLIILAMGSSSIEGAGASRPELGFVPLLESGLERRLPGVEITVINKGVGGETAKETADRLQREIAANEPDLVIWQLGTNDVLRRRPMDDFFADFRQGQGVLDRANVDVLLIDPQRLLDDAANPEFRGRNPELSQTARLIDLEGGRVGYAVLHRFAAMQGWGGLERRGIGPDELHLNDQGYACWAEITAEGLAAALRPVRGTGARPAD